MVDTERKLRVFLCHAKEDKPAVRELYQKLNTEGWMDIWLDEVKLLPGQEWDIEIENAVERADVVVVCLSTHSMDKEGYVQKELRFVLNLADEKPEGAIFVIPLRLDECTVPRRLRAWQYVDYFPKGNQEWAYKRLLESLKLRLAKLGIATSLGLSLIPLVQTDKAEKIGVNFAPNYDKNISVSTNRINLRAYDREIENLIEKNEKIQAIAHCRHVINFFPKHLETYRLLGKSYLQAKRYIDAVDIFKRVLMAVPDDFVSHVNMSIIADDQNRLDNAIWHMERAFEAQPSNTAIHAELQRLYGRRDGRAPNKIRLTRGALARMYVQGELYKQGIGEIRAVLSEDPDRTDMQVLLALAYFRSWQKVEASEICTKLILYFPYCLDANRILVEILPGTSMTNIIATYRSRVEELDPYAAFAKDSIFHSDTVPDHRVNLEWLDFSENE